ncbi:hypothetical protein [Candidatus Poriferisodalis sp.]|uniref:hypothetical protein n=1 Tax=Candidatus Poriferisodalis sp. TaxID=3101277 RepID=UPI003B0230D2
MSAGVQRCTGGRSAWRRHPSVSGPANRWIGGAGHELAHALYVPHPPGCDEGESDCDTWALTWAGYVNYPHTYLRDDEKALLLESSFITQP